MKLLHNDMKLGVASSLQHDYAFTRNTNDNGTEIYKSNQSKQNIIIVQAVKNQVTVVDSKDEEIPF